MKFGFETRYSKDKFERSEQLVKDIEVALEKVESSKRKNPNQQILVPGRFLGQLPTLVSVDEAIEIMKKDLEKARGKMDKLQGKAKDEAEDLNAKYDEFKKTLNQEAA